MKLAIVIPYFKLTFFRETLESLASQTDQRFTVYIGNDASPENPEGLLNEFQGKFKFVYKKFEENLGSNSLTKQWERCIEMMQDEEWFMILGDDDCLSENVVKEFNDNLQLFEDESNVVRFASRLIDGNSNYISEIFLQPKREDAIASYCRKLQGKTRSSLSEYIFRTESYNMFGFKDYFQAWSSDDRAIIDFSQDKTIFSLDAVVFIRNSDINISGAKKNLEEKNSSRLVSTKELIKTYKKSLTVEQNIILFGLYEEQFYLKAKLDLGDYLFLFSESLNLKGFSYFRSQVKSCIHKFIYGYKQDISFK